MLPAQLHHKVPLEFEDIEDLLTSSVFAFLARWAYAPGRLPARHPTGPIEVHDAVS